MKIWSKISAVFLCVSVIVGVFGLSSSAAEAFPLSASGVSNDQFTVTITFPSGTWDGLGFTLRLRFDPAAVQVVSTTRKDVFFSEMEMIPQITAVNKANESGEIGMTGNDVSSDVTSTGTYFRFTFKKTAAAPDTTTVSLVVDSFIDNWNQPLAAYTSGAVSASKTVTLKTSSDSSGSSTGGNTNSNTNTETNKSTKTNTNTNTNTNTSAKTNSESNISSQPATDTVSSVSSGAEVTDTESDVLSSSGAEGETDTETDVFTDLTDSPSSSLLSQTATASEVAKQPRTLSTGAVTGISLGVAALLCGVFVLIGCLRRK